jgi:hypothetical protein
MENIDRPSSRKNSCDASWPSPEMLIFSGSASVSAYPMHGPIRNKDNAKIVIDLIRSLHDLSISERSIKKNCWLILISE